MIDTYNIFYNKKINDNKSKLIEAFVIYYGEEYRTRVTNKINSIIFTWFRHSFLDDFYYKYKNDLNNSKDIKYFLDYDINEIIGSTDDVSLYKRNIKDVLDGSKYNLAANISLFNENSIIETINIPIFIVTDRVLIHEINHVVVRDNMFYIEENGDESLIRKDGLDVDTKYTIFEEIINDLSARDITNIYHKLGGTIFDTKFKVCNDYEKLFPIVEQFYYKYIDILKDVRISLNYNELFKYIDKNIYDKYVKFINKVFYVKREYDKKNKKVIVGKKAIDISNNYVNEMDKGEIKKLKLV